MKNNTYGFVAIILGIIIVLAVVIGYRNRAVAPATDTTVPNTDIVAGYEASKVQKETFTDTTNPGFEIKGEYPINIVGSEYIKGIIDTKIAEFKSKSDPAKLSAAELAEFGPTKDHQYSFITMYKAYSNPSYLTHRMDIYEFTGGAHGGTSAETYTYNQEGKPVSATDLFVDKAAIAKFSEIVKAQALALPDHKETINSEWLADSAGPDAVNFKAFAFSGTNLIIIFQQYAIAPYSDGIIEVPIPLSELGGILKPEFLK